MVISISEPHALVELLWIRDAYGLQPRGEDLPPLLSEAPAGVPEVPSPAHRDDWARVWPGIWDKALRHAGKPDDPALQERLMKTENASPERLDMLQRLIGPTWRSEVGDGALNNASYRAWSDRASQSKIHSRPASLEANPLRRDLEAVVPAWRAGMTKILTIPCDGEYTVRVGNIALLMTEQTLTASETFRPALNQFD